MLLSLFLTITLFQDQSQVDETLSVTRKQLRVRVADRQGKPVPELKAEQFVLEVNGRIVPFTLRESDLEARKIASLEAASGSERMSPMLPVKPSANALKTTPPAFRNAVLLVLDTNMQPMRNISKYKEAVKTYLEYLDEDDLVKLYQIDNQVRELSGFTRDKKYIAELAEKVISRASLHRGLAASQEEIDREVNDLSSHLRSNENRFRPLLVKATMSRIYQHVINKKNNRNNTMRMFCKNMDYFRRVLEPIAGDHSILLVSSGGFVDDASIRDVLDVVKKLNGVNIPVNALLLPPPSINSVTENIASFSLVKQYLKDPSRFSAGGGRSDLDPGSSSGDDGGGSEAFGSSRYGKETAMNLDPSLLDFSGMEGSNTGSDAAAIAFSSGTGGVMRKLGNKERFSELISAFAIATDHYYVLTYEADEKVDKVNVNLVGIDMKKNKVLYGKALESASAFASQNKATQQLSFEGSLLHGPARDELDVDWGAYLFSSKEGGHRFPVYGSMDIKNFPTKGYQIGFAALDANSETLDYVKMSITKPIKQLPFRFYDVLSSEKWPSRLRFYIRDMDTGRGHLSELIPPAPPDPEQTSLSSIIVTAVNEPSSAPFHLFRQQQKKDGTGEEQPPTLDPLMVGERLLPIGMGSIFPTGPNLRLFFQIQNLQGDLGQIKLNVTAADGENEITTPIKPLIVAPTTAGTYNFYADLDTSGLSAGEFELTIYMYNAATDKEQRYSRELKLR